MRSSLALAISAALGLACSEGSTHAAAPSAGVLSVCEVLNKDPTSLNGRVLSIRGVLGVTDEGTWLWGDCKTHLVIEGVEWANAISVYLDASDDSSKQSFAKLDAAIKEANLVRGSVW